MALKLFLYASRLLLAKELESSGETRAGTLCGGRRQRQGPPWVGVEGEDC